MVISQSWPPEPPSSTRLERGLYRFGARDAHTTHIPACSAELGDSRTATHSAVLGRTRAQSTCASHRFFWPLRRADSATEAEATAASCAAPAPLRRIPAAPAPPAVLPASLACTGRAEESVSGDYKVILRVFGLWPGRGAESTASENWVGKRWRVRSSRGAFEPCARGAHACASPA